MRLSSIFAAINLAGKVIATATRDPQDIPDVLAMVNTHAEQQCGKKFYDRLTNRVNPGFEIKGRGYDADPLPGFPTCWIWCPNNYRFKVALDANHRDILARDSSHMG